MFFLKEQTHYTMKLNVATATLLLAAVGQAAAEVSPVAYSTTSSLSKRDAEHMEMTIARLTEFNMKRSEMEYRELAARESQIVTDVLSAIKNTELAPKILAWLVKDPVLGPAASDLIVSLIKNKVINLEALLKALADSGLAVQVVKDLINDCTFYADIYKLVLNYISDLPNKILSLLSGGSSKRDDLIVPKRQVEIETRDSSDDLVTLLMESLKDSGLATQVVRQLITDPGFLEWGAKLIEDLFLLNALTLGEVIDAVINSGLVPNLIEGLLSFDTIKSVIVNALAAALGKCNGTTLTLLSATSTTTASPIPSGTTGTDTTIPTATSNPNPNCKKRRRSYNYNY